nr:very low-density lipoprotein receptor-like isoform X3 [Cherax quadricarinatus]
MHALKKVVMAGCVRAVLLQLCVAALLCLLVSGYRRPLGRHQGPHGHHGPHGRHQEPNGRYERGTRTCSDAEFTCQPSGKCIPKIWECDGDPDCPDSSDEEDCTLTTPAPPPVPSTTQTGRTCSDVEFTCQPSGKCIPKIWECDGVSDCPDSSDENCILTTPAPPPLPSTSQTGENCSEEQFRCESSGECIPRLWVCDDVSDCSDSSDEENCVIIPAESSPSSKRTCSDVEFTCQPSGKCILKYWKCDGDPDCPDSSDEENCTLTTPAPPLVPSTTQTGKTCYEEQFRCESSGECIPRLWVCDDESDCQDSSDEGNCVSIQSPAPSPPPPKKTCSGVEFTCQPSGKCIPKDWECDGDPDCPDSSDEENCTLTTPAPPPVPSTTQTGKTCSEEQFRCESSGECIPRLWVCDDESDCLDSSDEGNCVSTQSPAPSPPPSKKTCSDVEFTCQPSGKCIPKDWKCDGDPDCPDSSDEENCTLTTPAPPPVPSTTQTGKTCSEEQFRCESSGECIPRLWVCDDESDCLDSSDEGNCVSIQSPAPSPPPSKIKCLENYFNCVKKDECIPDNWRCDGEKDCLDGTDELECDSPDDIKQPSLAPPFDQFGHLKEDPCERKECSHRCLSSLLLPSGFICYCPSGMRLQDDRRTCVAKEPDQVMEFPGKTG